MYQLAEEKFFDMDFNVSISGRRDCLHFSREVLSEDSKDFFSRVKKVAEDAGAFGLAGLANQAVICAASFQTNHPSFSRPTPESKYMQCMEACDRIEFEPFKLICWTICTLCYSQESDS